MTNPAYQEFAQNILPLFEINRGNWLEQARDHALLLGADGQQITIDMVRAVCPPPEGVDPRVMGAVFQCGKNGRWAKTGYIQSRRKACHGRPVSVFVLKEYSA